MTQSHLWRGEWLEEAELESQLKTLGETLERDLHLRLDLEALSNAADALGREIMDGNRAELLTALTQAGVPAENGQDMLRTMAHFLTRSDLEGKLRRELGSLTPFALRRISYEEPVFEAWAPLGVLAHVAPGNVASVAPLSVLEGLLSGNINVLKTSSKEGNFAPLFLKALVDQDPHGALKPFVYVFRFSSQRRDLLSAMLQPADGVAVWGGEEAVAGVRAIAPPGARIIEWGHRISFTYVTPQAAADPEVLNAIAHDTCRIEQQACSSPQCLYLETEDRAQLLDFARRLAATLEEVSATYPPPQLDLHETAEITAVTELARLDSCLERTEVIEAEDKSWRVLVDFSPALRPSPLFRSLWVKPLPRSRIVEVLSPMRPYLQTVGLACALTDCAALVYLLTRAGATRLTQPGAMLTSSYPGEPHDGVYALQRYSRRVSLDWGNALSGIADFTDMEEASAPAVLTVDTPILTREGFQAHQVAEEFARLTFMSGGSSGAPKFSVFTYEDYHEQMEAAADGLFAAGLDPATDRCMNLFYGGHLYGGFLSFFSILEHLGAVQFPMSGVPDFKEVADAIVRLRVNTLLGMPNYLIPLMRKNADLFQKYRGLRKIFYGGEHLNQTQQDFFRQEFGVELIKSAAYGSNDAGPMGFACPFCTGGVHHVLRTQWLEIVDLDEDKPVAEGEIGRLLFTSRYRHGQDMRRYEIGDVGRWVPGPCPCGRKSPRFELLGRHGDVFRMCHFHNYRQIANILAEHLKYAGQFQIVLDYVGEKERMTLRLEQGCGLAAQQVIETLLAANNDLRQSFASSQYMVMEVAFLPPEQFEYIPTSGKLRSVIDRRTKTA